MGRRGFLLWRAAPHAALSSPLTMAAAAITALLSCFLATAAVLLTSSAGGAAVAYQTETVCPDAYGPTFAKTNFPTADAPAVVETVRRQAAAHGYGQPVVGMYTSLLRGTGFDGVNTYKTWLAYRGDVGLDNLELLRGSRQPGIWMGSALADLQHIQVGSQGNVQGFPLPPVTGVYRELTDPPPRWWCSQQRSVVIDRLANDPVDSILFTTDQQTFDRTVGAWGLPTLANLHFSFYDNLPRTPGEAQQQVERAQALVAGVDADLARQGLAGALSAQIPFARSAQIAEQAGNNVLFSILPLAVISMLVGCAGVGTVALQWYQRRHAQVRLLSARGSSPLAIGGLATAELGLPILAGGVLGIVLARLSLPAYAPRAELDPGPQVLAVGVACAVLVVALVLMTTVVALRAHREFQLGRVRRRANAWRVVAVLPWELLTAGLAVLGWSRLAGYSAGSQFGKPLPQINPLALTYPVFVVLTVGLVAARVVWLLLRASHRARLWAWPALQMAIRRLASSRAPVSGVLVIGVLAIGTLATGSGIATGQRVALDTKSGMFVGANTRIQTESSVGTGAIPLPAQLRGNSTLVGELTGTGSVVLVVDPATFTNAAWLGDLRGEDLNDQLSKLNAPTPGGTPALRVAHTAKQAAALPGLPPAVVIGDVPAFPIVGTQLGYVISRDVLTPSQLGAVPKWSVLSSAPINEVSSALAGLGVVQPNRLSKATALDALPFYVVEWTFSFVALLGAVLGVVAVLALLIAVEVRRRQNALAGALVLRMGMRPRALLGSHLIELGALAGLAVVAGVVCGVTVAGISVPRFDPARWLAPRSELPNVTPFVLAVIGVGILVVALTGWIAMRSVRTARTAELLRA